MKRFLLQTTLFLALLAALDYGYGALCRHLSLQAVAGTPTYTENHIASGNQIVMMGSSRMHHHYVSEMIAEATGKTVMNLGKDGSGIIRAYTYLNLLLEKGKPELILYDVSWYDMFYYEDLSPEEDLMRNINGLKNFCPEPGVSEMFRDLSAREWLKLQFNFYRYNSRLYELIHDRCTEASELTEVCGYDPLDGVLKEEPSLEENIGKTWRKDERKLQYFRKFIDLCRANGISLVFVASPLYKPGADNVDNDLVKGICEEKDVPFLDFYHFEELERLEYYQDRWHLNDKGARLFTRSLLDSLQNVRL